MGRALRQGEMRGKIYQLCLDQAAEDRAKFLFDWVLAPGDRVADVKRDIVAEVKARYGVDIALDRHVTLFLVPLFEFSSELECGP